MEQKRATMTHRDESRRFGFAQVALDAGLVVALVLVLLAVFGLDKWIGRAPVESAKSGVETTVTTVVAESGPQAVRKQRLGITPENPEFDNMGSLLDTLGEGYKYQRFPLDDLIDEHKLSEFDIIFLTCSGYPANWLGQQTGNSARGGGLFSPNPEIFAKAKESLRKYVGSGGTLYASDLHFILIAECFPEFVDVANVDAGTVQSVAAEVVDPGLREIIGPKIELRFDQPGWRPAAFRGDKATSYLRGEFQSEQDRKRVAPLLVKFPFQDGNVIFTSFHNVKQNSEIELQLLRYLVLTAVTAGVESQVNKTMMQGGFAPTKQNLFSASSGAQSATQTYHCTRVADLQFVLGFANQGARLKLTVTGPEGKALEKEGTSTVTIDVPGAAVGDWKYTVTALQVPNENFPFTVTVGQK